MTVYRYGHGYGYDENGNMSDDEPGEYVYNYTDEHIGEKVIIYGECPKTGPVDIEEFYSSRIYHEFYRVVVDAENLERII